MEEKTTETRVRINVSSSAKGLWQINATAEFPTEEETIKALSKAIDDTRAMLKEKGLREAGE